MTTPPRWRKSSHSGADEGNCVEIGDLGGRVGVRDSKDPAAGYLTLTRREFAALLADLGGVPHAVVAADASVGLLASAAPWGRRRWPDSPTAQAV
ncbi:DUF397 domain-containing protein [Spirillospora sp. NPDC046719]